MNGAVVGPAKSLAVKGGDKVTLSVQAMYQPAGSSSQTVAADVMMAVIAAFSGAGVVDGAMLYEGLSAPEVALSDALRGDDAGGVPQAYLNYILFDRYFVYQHFGALRISSAAASGAETLTMEVDVEQEGYLFAYVSNESNWNVNVFFDDFSITHEHTAVIGEDAFYPYGLSFKQQTERKNKYLYNGIELQDEMGLGVYQARYRTLDPALGRWWQADPVTEGFESWSPYNSNLNNPIRYNDPDGDIPPAIVAGLFLKGFVTDVSIQVGVNMAQGKSFLNAINSVDYGDATISGFTDVITLGQSSTSKVLVRAGTEIIKASSDITVERGMVSVFDDSKDETDASVDLVFGVVGDGTAKKIGDIGGNLLNSSAEKSLKQVDLKLKRTATGSENNINFSNQKADIQQTIQGNKTVSETISKAGVGATTEQSKENTKDMVNQIEKDLKRK